VTCGADYWDELTLDDLDDEPEDDVPEGPHLWLGRRWRPIDDLPDLANYRTAA
jgi:hypothetical protein